LLCMFRSVLCMFRSVLYIFRFEQFSAGARRGVGR
jgi:hypothetical protein